MTKCNGFERDGHRVNVKLKAGDEVRFKAPVSGQSAVEVMRHGVRVQIERAVERACERAALSYASDALVVVDRRPVPMGLHEESFGELLGRWCKKIVG